jgi:hypothetical protein
MKSVRFSDIEHVRNGRQRPPASFSLERLTVVVLTLGLGLPILILLLHRATPNTPLGYIVLPVLLGGLLPLSRVLQGRLEVSTRFDACHLVGALHEEVIKLGYVQAECGPGTVRYRSRPLRWLRRRTRDILVTVYEHGLEVTGPVRALRTLRRRMER